MARIGKREALLLEALAAKEREADALRFLWLDREPDYTIEVFIPGREYDTRERWHVHAAWRQSSAVLRIEPMDGASEGIYLLDLLPKGVEQGLNACPYRRNALSKCRAFYVDQSDASRRKRAANAERTRYGG